MSKFYLLLAFDALLFGTIAMALDLLMGYTGLVSFGHAAFFGLGAYASAALLERGIVSLWACLLFAILVVGLYALVVSFFATARRGIYFALLTLIFAEVVYTFFRYTQTFGGSDGIQGVAGAAADRRLRDRHAAAQLLSRPGLPGARLPRLPRARHLALRPGARGDPRERGPRALPRLQRPALQDGRVHDLGAAHRSRRRALPGALGVRDARPHAVDGVGRVHHHGHDRRARHARRAPSSAAPSSSCCRRRSRRTWTGTSS